MNLILKSCSSHYAKPWSKDDYVVLNDKRQVIGRIMLYPQAPKDKHSLKIVRKLRQLFHFFLLLTISAVAFLLPLTIFIQPGGATATRYKFANTVSGRKGDSVREHGQGQLQNEFQHAGCPL